jgi:hypothetical protein
MRILGIAVLAIIACAADTVCAIVQTCPVEFCPYEDTNDNALKRQPYTDGCVRFAKSQKGVDFIDYESGPAPKCKMTKTISGTFDCNNLR